MRRNQCENIFAWILPSEKNMKSLEVLSKIVTHMLCYKVTFFIEINRHDHIKKIVKLKKQGHLVAGYNGANVYSHSYNSPQTTASYGRQNYRALGNKVYNDVIEKLATTSAMF